MRKIALIILTLFIAVSCSSQTLNLCSNVYTAHAPISMTGQSNITIRGDSINCLNGGTVGINLTNCTNIHIVRCKIINSTKQGILMNGCKNIEIDSCDIENVSDGIHHNQASKPRGQKIQAPFYAHHNYFKNINGPFPLGNAIQLNNVGVAPGGGHVWIMYNSIENIDGQAQHPQDMISIYQSDGIVGDSIMVMYNYIRGGQIIKDSGGAAAIVTNDVGGDFQVARYNIIVNGGAVGIQSQGGNNSTIDHNKIFGDGHGAISFEGLQYGNYSGASTSNITEAYNQINWKQPNGAQFNLWFDAGSGVSAPIGWTTNTPVSKVDPTINANILPAQLLQTCTVVVTKPNINYSPGSYALTTGVSVNITPTNSGGAIPTGGWSISPSLPASLSFNTNTGQITGSPSIVTASTSYLVTGSNSGGSSSQTITISTANPIVNKPVISYSPNNITVTVNNAIPTLNPSNTGSAVTSWGISPSLPSNLVFNNGTISGIPVATQTATVYTISATNSAGTGTAQITITVNPVKPNISYAGTPYTFTSGSTIVPISPSNSGGAATYSISPSLPSGLSLSSIGVLSGTPSVTQGATPYNITAQNAGGSSVFPISITINAPAITPPNISYSPSSQTGTINVPITNMAPVNSGGAATSYTCTPSLPSGLNFNTANGLISGTSTVTSPSTSYTIVGSNSGGSSMTHVTIQINQIPSPSITYPYSSVVYVQGQAITPISPTNVGGAATSYAITSGMLVPGLTLNSSTGQISGTPSVTQSPTSFTVSASNSGGSSPFSISAAVNAPIVRYWYIQDGKFGYLAPGQ